MSDDIPGIEPLDDPAAAAELNGWRANRAGRLYIPRPDGIGQIYRRGEESVAEAFARDAKPKDERPRKSKTPPRKPPPAKADLRELEQLLSEAFRSPAVACAAFGDEWSADHFTNQGPALARNLVLSAEHNPWLRRKLEDAASGGDMAMQLVSLLGVAGALASYMLPPLIWWFGLGVPDKAREMFGIPKDRADARRRATVRPITPA
jgi:hypothetical protein